MTVLKKIVEKKKERLAAARLNAPIQELMSLIRDREKARDFRQAIKGNSGGVKVIAEIKNASPSRGLIRPDFDHKRIASVYESRQVDAISVITEEDFFQGKLTFLTDVKKVVSRPLLRKDFIFDEYQIYEARANEADAILLIASILERSQAEEYLHLSRELDMAVLFEVHDFKELETALKVNVPIIGINNRNLKTMEIDLNTTFTLRKEIPPDRVIVSESGIKSREDIIRIEAAKIDAILIGTSLLESDDIGVKIDQLLGKA
jgi:indole-3-glycerol phosphate synthase